MSAFLIWYFVTVSSNGAIVYSPPIKDKAECERVQKVMLNTFSFYSVKQGRCIEMKVIG
jgi:hypothetical protein